MQTRTKRWTSLNSGDEATTALTRRLAIMKATCVQTTHHPLVGATPTPLDLRLLIHRLAEDAQLEAEMEAEFDDLNSLTGQVCRVRLMGVDMRRTGSVES